MKTFKIFQPIVLGIRIDDKMLFNSINPNEFELFISKVTNILNKQKVDTSVISDNPYFFTKPFFVFSSGDYVFEWLNKKNDIKIKEFIRVLDDVYEQSDDDEIII